MFERYTEQARRAIFFARYEATQYGSRCIESEHLLLGVMREGGMPGVRIESIRKEIESHITIRERISTSREVPLSQECKRILNYAAEEAQRINTSAPSISSWESNGKINAWPLAYFRVAN